MKTLASNHTSILITEFSHQTVYLFQDESKILFRFYGIIMEQIICPPLPVPTISGAGVVRYEPGVDTRMGLVRNMESKRNKNANPLTTNYLQ